MWTITADSNRSTPTITVAHPNRLYLFEAYCPIEAATPHLSTQWILREYFSGSPGEFRILTGEISELGEEKAGR